MGQEVSLISKQVCFGSTTSSDESTRRSSRIFMFVEEVQVPPTELGESPHWCSITESLFYIDITGKAIHQYIPSTKTSNHMLMESAVGFAVPTDETSQSNIRLFVGLETNIVEVNFSTKEMLRVIATLPESVTLGGRFNDGKCNHNGRLYTGYMNTKWRSGKHGNVYQLIKSKGELSVEPGDPGSAESAMQLLPMFNSSEFHLPNGLTWCNDNRAFYVDSASHTIRCYNEVSTNYCYILERRDVVFTLTDDDIASGYMLDGITIDHEGKLWVALVGASCLIRINPDNGKEIMRLRLPIQKPTACTFGGPDLSDLYITSRSDVNNAETNGKLYVARLDGIRGLGAGVPVSVKSESSLSSFFNSFLPM